MSNLGISSHNMQLLAEKVKLHIKEETLLAGLSLLQKDKIISLHADNSGYRIHAKIQDLSSDDIVHSLIIDVELFQFSQCSCEESQYCAHVAAAFLLAYSLSGHNAEQWASARAQLPNETSGNMNVQPQATEKERPSRAAAKNVSTKLSDSWKQALSKNEVIVSSMEAAAASGGNVEQTATAWPNFTDPASQWHRYIDDVLGRLLKSKPLHSNEFMKRGLELLTLRSTGGDSLHKALFELHMRLSLVHHTYRNLNTVFKSDQYLNRFHTSQYLSTIINDLHQSSQTVDWPAFLAKHPGRAEELQVILSKYAFDHSSPEIAEDWLELYRMVWGLYIGILDGSEETNRLQRALKRTAASSVEHEHISMALSYWEFRRGNDAGAIKRLEKLRHPWNPGIHLTYAHTRHAQRQWPPTLQWLRFIAKIAAKQSYGYFHANEELWSKLFGYWSSGIESATAKNEWLAWLLDYIEYVYEDYETYLLERKRYKEWFDIMLCANREPDVQHESLLRKLEQSNPDIVLPFYHQHVDYWIGRKNREGYRNAVFFIKKLAQMYKKMRDTRGWERYIAHLTTSYARYRAFQEELKKGHVIT